MGTYYQHTAKLPKNRRKKKLEEQLANSGMSKNKKKRIRRIMAIAEACIEDVHTEHEAYGRRNEMNELVNMTTGKKTPAEKKAMKIAVQAKLAIQQDIRSHRMQKWDLWEKKKRAAIRRGLAKPGPGRKTQLWNDFQQRLADMELKKQINRYGKNA